MRKPRLALAAAIVTATTVLTAAAAAGDAGFQTGQPAMLTCSACRSVTPIMSVGDTLPSGYRFEALPDGISLGGGDDDDGVDIYVNHELSLVPFPSTRQDPSNATVSKLRLNEDAEVVKGEYVIPTSAGYQRFCSSFIVGRQHGFARPLLFTNEEARDIVLRQEDSWHQTSVLLTESGAEQAGVVVAYDVRNGSFRAIYGMGRHNHENAVGIPGYGYPVVLSGDDTFDAPASQLYLYKAESGADVWNDNGELYAFVSDDPAVNDYGDVTAGMEVEGHFIKVPRAIATGKDPLDGSEVTSGDFGYPTPATAVPPTAAMPDGPQWVLEHWSNINNVFQFIRVEDIAYDRRNPRTVYLADTGEPRAVPHANGRLSRGASGTNGLYMNGRLFKLELGRNPLRNAELSILRNANFDLGGYARANVPHQPDNMETTRSAIYFQEDPGTHNSSAPPVPPAVGPPGYPAFPDATNARIWRYDLRTGELRVIAEVDQSVGPTTIKGTWESSGIVDASSAFGRGAFLVDVEAHTWDQEAGAGNDAPAVPKRENGQLLLIKVRDP